MKVAFSAFVVNALVLLAVLSVPAPAGADEGQVTASDAAAKEEVITGLNADLDKVRAELAAAQTKLKEDRARFDQLQLVNDQLLKEYDAVTGALAAVKLGDRTAAEAKLIQQENEVLRGIIMRAIKVEARREQAYRLAQEEMERLEIRSDTLYDLINQLAKPTVEVNDPEQERRIHGPCPPRDPTVEVMRGGTVEVSLNAGHRNLNRLEYGVIGQPRYGRLSQLTQYQGPKGQALGSVIYTHGNDPDSTTDIFAFEFTDPTTGQRGRGRIRILVLDAPGPKQRPDKPGAAARQEGLSRRFGNGVEVYQLS